MNNTIISEDKIKQTLLNLGLYPHYSGFSYLVYAVDVCCKNESIRSNPQKQVYEAISQKFGIAPDVAIQSVRRAIHAAWEHPNEYQDKLFGYRGKDTVPSALEVVTRISDAMLHGGELA